MSFFWSQITLICKIDKYTVKNENHAIPPRNMDTNNLNKIFAKQIQQHMEKIKEHSKVVFVPECKNEWLITHNSVNVINHKSEVNPGA